MNFFEAHDLAMTIHTKDRNLQYEEITERPAGSNVFVLVMHNYATGANIEFHSWEHWNEWHQGRRLLGALIREYGKGA